jgi:hypothetical protein
VTRVEEAEANLAALTRLAAELRSPPAAAVSDQQDGDDE